MSAFRCWLHGDAARPDTPNVVALNAAFAAERFVERDMVLADGEEILVAVEDVIGRPSRFIVGLEVTFTLIVRSADRAPDPLRAVALEELHSDELAEGAS